ncbi:uncharacterized protein YALI1_F36059g [Yarrowia lipolytica]|nr:hypothetical protein YALI1_F36059g [Yarrowia lipolytica]
MHKKSILELQRNIVDHNIVNHHLSTMSQPIENKIAGMNAALGSMSSMFADYVNTVKTDYEHQIAQLEKQVTALKMGEQVDSISVTDPRENLPTFPLPIQRQKFLELVDRDKTNQIYVYSGEVTESPALWASRIENIMKTFNFSTCILETSQVVSKLLGGKALLLYRKQKNQVLPWVELKRLVHTLDKPVLRSIAVHKELAKLEDTDLPIEYRIKMIRHWEPQLDPSPLGDRVVEVIRIIPEKEADIMKAVEGGISSFDQLLGIMGPKDESSHQPQKAEEQPPVLSYKQKRAAKDVRDKTCTYCHKEGHKSSQCFKRPKR